MIKELKQQLDEQRDANESLNKRLDLLEKRNAVSTAIARPVFSENQILSAADVNAIVVARARVARSGTTDTCTAGESPTASSWLARRVRIRPAHTSK